MAGREAFRLRGEETLRTCQKVHFSKSVKRPSVNQCQPNDIWHYKSKEIKFLKLHCIWPQSEKGQTTSKMPGERQLFITERSPASVADRRIFHLKPEYKTSNPPSTAVSDSPQCSEQVTASPGPNFIRMEVLHTHAGFLFS